MQTTLLAVGIAIILALLTALVGPFFVNWSDYRALFEAQASRIAGAPVQITGDISARLLPIPTISLRGVAMEDHATVGSEASTVRAEELHVEFALGGALRGEWRANEVRLVGAEADVRLDEQGRLQAIGLNPVPVAEALSIDRLVVREGRIRVWNAGSSQAPQLVEGVWFVGDARSLIGPVKGEGGFTSGDNRNGFRLSLGRLEGNAARLRLTWEAAERPLGGDADGVFRLEDGIPRFEGMLRVARPADVGIANGRVINREPWTVASRVRAAPSGILFEQLDLEFGAEQRALKLSGTAELKLGARPRLDAVVSARQLDLDRFVALPEATRRLPLVALQAAAEQIGDRLMPSIPVRIGLSVESLTLAGNSVQAVRGDLVGSGEGWTVDALEFRAPGFTQVQVSGRWTGQAEASFTGPVSIESVEPRILAAWLEGRSAVVAAQGAPLGRFRAAGALTLAPGRFGLERFKAEIDKKEMTGRLVYEWGPERKHPRLEAEVRAAELDIDALAHTVRAAIPDFGADLPGEISLAFELGRASIAGIEAKDASGQLVVNGNSLAIDRLNIRDLSGSSIGVAGGIENPWGKPRGSMLMTISGDRIDGVIAVAERFFPRAAGALKEVAPRLGRTELQVRLEVEEATESADGSTLRMRVGGSAGGAEVSFHGTLVGYPRDWSKARLSGEGRIEARTGQRLLRLLKLEEAIEVGAGPGTLDWSVSGKFEEGLLVRAHVRAQGLDAAAEGELQVKEEGLAGTGDVTVEARNVPALRPLVGKRTDAIPLKFSGPIGLEPGRVSFERLAVSAGDMTASGWLAFWFGERTRVEGRLEADLIHASALIATAAGVSAEPVMRTGAASHAQPTIWSTRPFAPGAFSTMTGTVELRAAQAKLEDWPDIRQFSALLRIGETGVGLEEIRGTMAAGNLAAHVEFATGDQGASADIRVSLNGADLAELSPAKSRSLARGRISLQLEAKGLGRSPASLMGALGGAGTVSFKEVELTRLDPRVFDAVARAADETMDIDPGKVTKLANAALGDGRLRIDNADGALTLAAGQLRLGNMLAKGEGADLAVNASFDLLKGAFEARLALMGRTGSDAPAAGRPEILVALRGEPDQVERTIDVSSLVGWLTLRAVDLQAKRLEELEAERRTRREQDAAASARDAEARSAAPAPSPGTGVRSAPPRPAPASPPLMMPEEWDRRSPATPGVVDTGDRKNAGLPPRETKPAGDQVRPDPAAASSGDQHSLPKPPSASSAEAPAQQSQPTATASEPSAAQAPPLPPPINIVPAPRPRNAEPSAATRKPDRSGDPLPPPPPATFNPLRLFDLFGAAR